MIDDVGCVRFMSRLARSCLLVCLRINSRTCALALNKAAKWKLSAMGSGINKCYCCPQPCFTREDFQLQGPTGMVSVRLGEATLVPKLDYHTRLSPYIQDPPDQQMGSEPSIRVSLALSCPALPSSPLPCTVNPCCALFNLPS